jgi:ubiquinone/menaquinone biosynthesis C-methylase UbiE
MHKHSETIEQPRAFLPAAGKDWLLPLYDPVVRLFGGNALRKKLVEQAAIHPDHDVLEIGCGTGSVLLMIKDIQPTADLTGLDPDPKALERANRKASRKWLHIRLDQGFSDQLPYADESFHRVLSSFMFHHLPDGEKTKTLLEVRRVLKPGGSFHMLDFEQSESGSKLSRWLHSSEHLKDNSERRILSLLKAAGFTDAKTAGKGQRFLLRVGYYLASR